LWWRRPSLVRGRRRQAWRCNRRRELAGGGGAMDDHQEEEEPLVGRGRCRRQARSRETASSIRRRSCGRRAHGDVRRMRNPAASIPEFSLSPYISICRLFTSRFFSVHAHANPFGLILVIVCQLVK
jgi:hypothetical protein